MTNQFEALLEPKKPLYLIPSALPGTGKTTFLNAYVAFMRAKGKNVIYVGHDDAIHAAVKRNKTKFPEINYVGAHTNNYGDDEEHLDKKGTEQHLKACHVMDDAMTDLENQERLARQALEQGEADIVIHDDIFITRDARANLLERGLIGTFDRPNGKSYEADHEYCAPFSGDLQEASFDTAIATLEVSHETLLAQQDKRIREAKKLGVAPQIIPPEVLDYFLGIHQPPLAEEDTLFTHVITAENRNQGVEGAPSILSDIADALGISKPSLISMVDTLSMASLQKVFAKFIEQQPEQPEIVDIIAGAYKVLETYERKELTENERHIMSVCQCMINMSFDDLASVFASFDTLQEFVSQIENVGSDTELDEKLTKQLLLAMRGLPADEVEIGALQTGEALTEFVHEVELGDAFAVYFIEQKARPRAVDAGDPLSQSKEVDARSQGNGV